MSILLRMCKTAIALASLACAGHGRRAQGVLKQLQSSRDRESHKPPSWHVHTLESLTNLLLAFDQAAGFSPSGQATSHPRLRPTTSKNDFHQIRIGRRWWKKEPFESAGQNLNSELPVIHRADVLMAVKRSDRKKKAEKIVEVATKAEEAQPEQAQEEAAEGVVNITGNTTLDDELIRKRFGKSVEEMSKEEIAENAANEVMSFSTLEDFLRAFANAPITNSSSPPGCEKIFALQSPEVFNRLRVGTLDSPPDYDELLSKLLEISEEELEEFMQVNRDLYDYRFLHRLMSMRIQAKNTKDIEREQKMYGALQRALSEGWKFDLPLKNQVSTAEARLGGLLARVMQKEEPTANEVIDAAGDGPLAVFAFWFVLQAAIAAWDEKLTIARRADDQNGRGMAKQRLEELGQLQGAILSSPVLLERGDIEKLNGLLAVPNLAYQFGTEKDAKTFEAYRTGSKFQLRRRMMARYPDYNATTEEEDLEYFKKVMEKAKPKPGDNEGARKKLEELAPEPQEKMLLLRRLGCLALQADRHRFKQFNPLMRRATALYDVLLYGQVRYLDPVDLKEPPEEFETDVLGNRKWDNPLIQFMMDGTPGLSKDELEDFNRLYL
mmetsp:Transcript_123199/g.223936  ORF Transcript_123199/g.223936 Transcript_123199/m.223936 type:complete len:608 (-) Transcript_123199:180-2003(-)